MFTRNKLSGTQGQQALRFGLATALAVSAFTMSPLVQAADAKAKAAPTKAAPATSGMRMAKDPVTGEIRALTAAEAAELDAQDAKAKAAANVGKRRAASASSEGSQEFTLPNGMVGMNHDESMMSYAVVTRKPDGTLDMACVQGKQAADAVVKGKKQNSSKAVTAAKEHGHDHQ